MKSAILGLIAFCASTVSAFPSTARHGHLHSHKRQEQGAWTGASVPGYGLAYDLMADNGGCRTYDQISREISQFASEGYKLIRTYDVGCDVGALAAVIAANPGMKLFAGINGVDNVASDLQKLINYLSGNWAVVDTINIGNEVVNAGGSAAAVTAALSTARGMLGAAGYTGSIVTVDTFVAHLANPSLCAASDYCAANCHAFFDGNVAAEGAGEFVKRMQTAVANIGNGKRVIITESGWPTCGTSNGIGYTGYAQQSSAVASLKSAFSATQSELILFQSYNAVYKNVGANNAEQCWGIHH